MRNALFSFVFAAVSGLLIVAVRASFASAASGTRTVTIGVIVPLTGDMASHGIEIQRAMELAKKQLTGTKYAYELRFEDNRLDAAASVTAAKKLVEIDKVDVIVTLWPPTAVVVAPITEQAGVLHYTIAWDPALAKQHKLMLSHQVMVNDVVASTLQLLKDQGVKQAALLHMEETGFNLGAKNFEQLAEGFGIRLVAKESFPGSTTDFRSLLDRVMKSGPDGYVVWSVAPSLDLVVKQLAERQPKAVVTGYFDYATGLAAVEGKPYVSEMYADDDFKKAFRAEYQAAPASKGPNAYDIFKLLVKVYEKSPDGKPAAAEVKAALTRIRDFRGAVGVFSIDADGNSSYSPVRRQVYGEDRVLVGGAR